MIYLTRSNEFQTIVYIFLCFQDHTPSSDLKVFVSFLSPHSWFHLSSCYWTTPSLTLVNKLNRFLFTSHCLLACAPKRTPLYNCWDGEKGKRSRRQNQSLPPPWRCFWSTAVLPSCIWTHPTFKSTNYLFLLNSFFALIYLSFYVCFCFFCYRMLQNEEYYTFPFFTILVFSNATTSSLTTVLEHFWLGVLWKQKDCQSQ